MSTHARTIRHRIQEIWPLLPAALYLLGFLILVVTYLLGLSFSAAADSEGAGVTLQHFAKVFQNRSFWTAWRNTIVFVAVGTPLELCVGFFFAILIYSTQRGKGLLRAVFITPFAVPAIVTATIVYILVDYPTGHINSFLMGEYPWMFRIIDSPINWKGGTSTALGVSLMGKIWRDMPITMLILLAGLNAINRDLIDAAKTMGAGFRLRMQHVIVPSILPAISAVLLLRSIEMWKEFIFPFVIARQYNLLGTFIESLYRNWGDSHQAAVVALVMVLSIVVTLAVFFTLMNVLTKLTTDRNIRYI
jgi:ABC-type sugar transport system permease subunit